MFDIAPTELLVLAIVALVVIGPKDLPKALRFVGNWMGKARRMAAHFRAGVDNMVREAELDELKKEWEEQNKRIMAQFPNADDMSPTMRDTNPGFPDAPGAGDPLAKPGMLAKTDPATPALPSPPEGATPPASAAPDETGR